MEYSIKAISSSKSNASVQIKTADIPFGITPESADNLPNPAELFLGSLSACILKDVERFSAFMHFEYTNAEVTVKAVRLENPPKMDDITYELIIYSKDSAINLPLLKKNIEKFGTIYNTVKDACSISGEIKQMTD